MISIAILVHEFLLLIYLVFFKLNSNDLVRYIRTDFPDRLKISDKSIKTRDIVQKIIFAFLTALFILNLIMVIFNQPYPMFLIFISFIILSFTFCLTSPGRLLSAIFISTKSETYFKKEKIKLINTLVYFVFIVGFLSIAIYMFVSNNLNSYAKEVGFSEVSDKEFPIDFETNLFVEDEYLYLYSDFANGINVYDLNGEFIHSYYFYGGINGSSMIYFKDDYFFISTKDSSALIRYKDGMYQGHLEVEYFDDYDSLIVYDEFGDVLISSIQLEDYWTIFAFDDEFIYYESDSGGGGYFKTDGTTLEQWNKDVTTFISQTDDGDFSLRGNEVYKQNEVIISSSEIHFVITNFFYVWVLLFMNFSIIFSLTKLIYLNKLTDKREIKPIASKTAFDLIDRYKKSIRLDFFVSILFSIVIFILYNLLFSNEISEVGIILFPVLFILTILLNELAFNRTSLGKRIQKIRVVDTETNTSPKVSSVIKRRWMEMFSSVEMNLELLDRIDTLTRTKIIDLSNKSD